MIEQECFYSPPHVHEFPDDWEFGGPNGTDPAADPRYLGSSYQYLDSSLRVIFTTSAPRCDDEALDDFTSVASWSEPVYITVRRPGEREFKLMKFRYDKKKDMVYNA